MSSVIQDWVNELPMMQQTVLLTAIRGPDGLPKYGSIKMLLRWFRRCVLLSAIDGRVLDDPCEPNGGSFTGPSTTIGELEILNEELRPIKTWEEGMNLHVDDYLKSLDGVPHHFQMHFMHAVEIVGYKHPDRRIGEWWYGVYCRLVNDMHLHIETAVELDERLGDTREGWLKRADPATTA